jgi:hypothetical protein
MKRHNPRHIGLENPTIIFFEQIALFIVLACLLLFSMPGCATTPQTAVTTGSDNATVLADSDSGVTAAQLLQYADLAEQEALSAWQLFESTKDETALQQVAWWLQYALGVAQHIEAINTGEAVKRSDGEAVGR